MNGGGNRMNKVFALMAVLGLAATGCRGDPQKSQDIIGKFIENGQYKIVGYDVDHQAEVYCVTEEEYNRLRIGMDDVQVVGFSGDACK